MSVTTEQSIPGLEVNDVSLQIDTVSILDSISFSVPRGAAVGLIGANGSGKSSLLNVVSGYYRATSGRVLIDGNDMTGMKAEAVSAVGVGRSFQSIGRMQELTVRELVALGLEPVWKSSKLASIFGLNSARRAEANALELADDMIASYGIGEYADAPLRDCPYGVRKMADLLRSVICRPKVLLLDEPTSGVAASDRRVISELIKQWRAESTCSVVLVDHDVSFVAGLASTLVALSAGRAVDSGPPADVLANPTVLATFVGESASSSSDSERDLPHAQ